MPPPRAFISHAAAGRGSHSRSAAPRLLRCPAQSTHSTPDPCQARKRESRRRQSRGAHGARRGPLHCSSTAAMQSLARVASRVGTLLRSQEGSLARAAQQTRGFAAGGCPGLAMEIAPPCTMAGDLPAPLAPLGGAPAGTPLRRCLAELVSLSGCPLHAVAALLRSLCETPQARCPPSTPQAATATTTAWRTRASPSTRPPVGTSTPARRLRASCGALSAGVA